ncbi:pentatricopeptide repeat containing protein [Coccidioides posadasii C735 delta SOWgp]|uniref:Pentatricopeptide repeat containing protein n=1 Tax=Coccidioides posadasii (strain C735) TaxID=222929 RepID=C5PHJ8_COCP7|nr:pentatricopeptide repeat containing protein [Coccidioides posadasii C735 delta SOWgp]EER24001.1 pentatricopeptide repeat containing protein [Coccidioides posadasii C735 delta SOWgp]|eukprot:XP_003066146.1 pentatricopeptide repeat containing protein [Coccidioides posadasii C735 delta SOWgp]
MRSHLTRGVFQAIVENRPYVHSQCSRQLTLLLSSRQPRRCPFLITQSRTAFSLPFLPRADNVTKSQLTDNGAKQMMELVNALEQKTLPPPPFILAKAFMAFIQERGESMAVLTQNQVRFLLQTFQHLVNEYPYKGARGSVRTVLGLESLENTMFVLAQAGCEPDAVELLNKLAKAIYIQISHRNERAESPHLEPTPVILRSYVSILASTGSPLEALNIVETYWETVLSPEGIIPWLDIISGLAKEGKESEIPVVMGKMDRCGVVLDPNSHEEMVKLLAAENNVDALRKLFELELPNGLQPTATSTAFAIATAVRNSMVDWASQLSESFPAYPTPESRDAMLLLAAAKSEGAENIQKILDSMSARNPEIKTSMTIATFNPLLEHANMTNRLDLVDEYAELARKWGLQADAQTYMLMMDSKLREGDLDGAIALFANVDPEGLAEQTDVVMLNRILRQLCSTQYVDVDYDTILSFVDRLIEARGRFEAETLGALCQVLLSRHELESISGLLRPVIDQYNADELSTISESFVKYISDQNQSTEDAWEAYELLNMAFPNTSVRIRTDIMTQFFERGRSDLACLVFGHMRQKERGPRRPTSHTYAMCLQGISRAADSQGLHLVHNMLKLDLEVGLTTKVLNGLMLAYAACGMPEKAMGFFREILHSEEGPSEQTLMIFFRVCETYHSGVEEATKMLDKLKSLDVRIDRGIYNAYIGALAGHCQVEKATEAIQAMESKIGAGPSTQTLGTLYNAIPFQYWKDQVEEWAQATYPGLWEELEQRGRHEDEEGLKSFDINRNIDV